MSQPLITKCITDLRSAENVLNILDIEADVYYCNIMLPSRVFQKIYTEVQTQRPEGWTSTYANVRYCKPASQGTYARSYVLWSNGKGA